MYMYVSDMGRINNIHWERISTPIMHTCMVHFSDVHKITIDLVSYLISSPNV